MPELDFFVIMKTVAVLACIVGLMFFIVWLLKKLAPGVVRGPAQRVDLRLLTQLSLGSRQKLVVVRVADRTLLIGVAEGSITTLAELSLPNRAPTAKKEADEPKIFADLLAWRKDSPEPAAEPSKKSAPSPAGPSRPRSDSDDDEGPRLFAPGERPLR